MDSSSRRENIISILKAATAPISAGRLASEFGVSRQIIVGDIALIRASGIEIDATPKGYILHNHEEIPVKHTQIACMHTSAQTEEELNICVDNGCRVIDVIVEHPVYGQLTGLLDISNRYDIKNFMRKSKAAAAHNLSELTDGIHLHTLEYTDEEAVDRVIAELKVAGILYEES